MTYSTVRLWDSNFEFLAVEDVPDTAIDDNGDQIEIALDSEASPIREAIVDQARPLPNLHITIDDDRQRRGGIIREISFHAGTLVLVITVHTRAGQQPETETVYPPRGYGIGLLLGGNGHDTIIGCWPRSRPGPRCQPCREAARVTLYGADPVAQRRGDNRDRQRRRRAAGTALSPGNHRSRALRFGVEYEYVDRRRVFIRDRWRCGICRRPVDKRLKYPHPRSASLDHIVPMSKGGGHTYLNTQCGHLDCNLRKLAAGEGEQLALLG